jgi:hypothetical protein
MKIYINIFSIPLYSTWFKHVILKMKLLGFVVEGVRKLRKGNENSFFTYLQYLGSANLKLHCATTGRSRVLYPMLSLEFFINIILLAALWP